MPLSALVLVLLSCLLHVGWNLFGKKVSPTPAFFTLAFAFGSLLLLPLVGPSLPLVAQAPPRFWALLVSSALCQALYSWSLAGAYASGEISLCYPLARALPVVMVALAGVWLYPSAPLTALQVGCMLLVVVGALLLPMRHPGDLRLAHYRNAATGWALLAALATTGYSLLDAVAIKLLRAAVSEYASDMALALLYIWLQALGTLLALLTLQLGRRRRALLEVGKRRWRVAALSGAMMLLTYWLILWAMQYADNVSYVVAFRQFSIPLGVLLGIWLLGEPGPRMKWIAVLLMLGGLVVLALYRQG
ncbi:multidrug transporter [Marinobacterium nitratireducens]|uniref:Multidrug transporter n=1 Tax=Marinobacterium nitratireducens TaxID=518897 RepID=A0A917Z622_9GAMM|nr:drug/metabolite transporter [Marinobacterium nitratireducens]GGO75428.1 multidrug transporter [Marinobacterium nitratireducens]